MSTRRRKSAVCIIDHCPSALNCLNRLRNSGAFATAQMEAEGPLQIADVGAGVGVLRSRIFHDQDPFASPGKATWMVAHLERVSDDRRMVEVGREPGAVGASPPRRAATHGDHDTSPGAVRKLHGAHSALAPPSPAPRLRVIQPVVAGRAG